MNESQILNELAALRAEVAELRAQVASLSSPTTMTAETPIPDEVVTVIGAVVAAFLGKRSRIKSVKASVEGDAWSSQGRVAIQGSHRLS